jgi:predicted DsbA family dithiol-disulfide isomerase
MNLDIDVVSDFVCPWCFLGKVRLDSALRQLTATHPSTVVRVNWLPFLLNPGTPAAGEPYRPFLEAKFGGRRQADAVLAAVAEAAAPDGLSFAFERIRNRPNTLDAHRLCYRAQSRGYRQEQVRALADALFAAHFQRGLDIGDVETLADLAATCGDKREAVLAYLDSDRDVAAVKRMAAQVQQQGIDSVPYFIIDRKLGVAGAQSATVLGAALLQAQR